MFHCLRVDCADHDKKDCICHQNPSFQKDITQHSGPEYSVFNSRCQLREKWS